MRKYIKILILAAILIAASLLCSCRARPYLSVECNDLPQGTELKMLIHLDENDPDFMDGPKEGYFPYGAEYNDALTELESVSQPYSADSSSSCAALTAEEKYEAFLETVNAVGEEHLYNYNEDGWRSADYYMSGDSYTDRLGEDTRFYFPAKYFYIQDFVCAYPELRIAVVDGDGRVCRISDIADMTPEGKAAAYTELNYSYENNTLTPQDLRYLKINGRKPDSYLIWFGLLLAACDIAIVPLLIIISAVYGTGRNHRDIGFVIIFVMLSIGNIPFNANYLTLELVPRFDLEGDGLTLENIKNLLLVNGLWLVELILFCVIRSRPRRQNLRSGPNFPSDTDKK